MFGFNAAMYWTRAVKLTNQCFPFESFKVVPTGRNDEPKYGPKIGPHHLVSSEIFLAPPNKLLKRSCSGSRIERVPSFILWWSLWHVEIIANTIWIGPNYSSSWKCGLTILCPRENSNFKHSQGSDPINEEIICPIDAKRIFEKWKSCICYQSVRQNKWKVLLRFYDPLHFDNYTKRTYRTNVLRKERNFSVRETVRNVKLQEQPRYFGMLPTREVPNLAHTLPKQIIDVSGQFSRNRNSCKYISKHGHAFTKWNRDSIEVPFLNNMMNYSIVTWNPYSIQQFVASDFWPMKKLLKPITEDGTNIFQKDPSLSKILRIVSESTLYFSKRIQGFDSSPIQK